MKRLGVALCLLLFVAALAYASEARASACTAEGSTVSINGEDYEDSDGDGVIDPGNYVVMPPEGTPMDNCPNVPNGDCDEDPKNCNADCSYDENAGTPLSQQALAGGYQADWDGDGVGDACDDYDLDGILDYIDNCKVTANPSQDPSYCSDLDGDRFEDVIDNCPERYNIYQIDSDEDGIGDPCDVCYLVYNPGQEDSDHDGRGDACPLRGDETTTRRDDGTNTSETPGTQFQLGPDITKGKGGCTLMPGAASPMSVMMLLASISMVFVVRKRRQS